MAGIVSISFSTCMRYRMHHGSRGSCWLWHAGSNVTLFIHVQTQNPDRHFCNASWQLHDLQSVLQQGAQLLNQMQPMWLTHRHLVRELSYYGLHRELGGLHIQHLPTCLGCSAEGSFSLWSQMCALKCFTRTLHGCLAMNEYGCSIATILRL